MVKYNFTSFDLTKRELDETDALRTLLHNEIRVSNRHKIEDKTDENREKVFEEELLFYEVAVSW
jgi:hypothetical protein